MGEMDKVAKLREIGVDIDAALERLGGVEDLYFMIVPKFLEDNNYDLFLNDMENNAYDDAMHHIHTLKGAAYNMGFQKIGDCSASIMEKLRDEDYNGLDDLIDELSREYHLVRATLIELGL